MKVQNINEQNQSLLGIPFQLLFDSCSFLLLLMTEKTQYTSLQCTHKNTTKSYCYFNTSKDNMVSTVHQLQSQANHQADDEVPHQNKPSPSQISSFFTKILASAKSTTQNEKMVNITTYLVLSPNIS
jgi:hypothetical protein